jgi:hypothetical protein
MKQRVENYLDQLTKGKEPGSYWNRNSIDEKKVKGISKT